MTTAKRTAKPATTERTLRLDQIDIGPLAMRTAMDHGELTELATSLSTYGQLNAVVVIAKADRFELVAGHRRCAAAEMLGWTEVRASVRSADDFQAFGIAWTENAARADVTVTDQARFIAAMMERTQLSQNQTAATLGMSAGHLSDVLSTLAYPAELREALEAGAISARVARELNRIDDEAVRTYYLGQAAEFGCSVRAAVEWVRTWQQSRLVNSADAGGTYEPAAPGAPAPSTTEICSACRLEIRGSITWLKCCPSCSHMILTGPSDPAAIGANGH